MTFVGAAAVVDVVGTGFAACVAIGLTVLVDARFIFASSFLFEPKNDDFNFLIFSFGLSVGPIFRIAFLELPSVMSA